MRYAIVRLSDNTVMKSWGELPKTLDYKGQRWIAPVEPGHVGFEAKGHRFVELVVENASPPDMWHSAAAPTVALTATRLTVTKVWTPWSQSEKDAAEAARKLSEANGFLASGMAPLIYELAKIDTPSLTQAQFATWVRNTWG